MLIHRILLIQEDNHLVISHNIQVNLELEFFQWKPAMPTQPRLVYPTQPMQTVSNIPTTPVFTTEPQSQAQTVVSQPVQADPSSLQPQVSSQEVQVSQVVIQ